MVDVHFGAVERSWLARQVAKSGVLDEEAHKIEAKAKAAAVRVSPPPPPGVQGLPGPTMASMIHVVVGVPGIEGSSKSYAPIDRFVVMSGPGAAAYEMGHRFNYYKPGPIPKGTHRKWIPGRHVIRNAAYGGE